MPQAQDMNSFFAAVCSDRETILASNNSIPIDVYRNELASWTGPRRNTSWISSWLYPTFWLFNFQIFFSERSVPSCPYSCWIGAAYCPHMSPSRSHQICRNQQRCHLCAEMWTPGAPKLENHFMRRRFATDRSPSSTAASVKTEASCSHR